MKISDLHKAFKVLMDKNSEAVAFGGCPAFLPEEIDLFLNQAYIEVICNKYTGNNTMQVGFEGAVKRIADLQKLIKTDSAQNLVYPYASSNVLTLSNFFKDGEELKRMFYVDCVLHYDNEVSTCILIDHDKAGKFLQTYNNLPWIDTPVAVLEDNTLKIYIDPIRMEAEEYTTDITYVKYPELIQHTDYNRNITEVPDYILNEVVNRAVVIALENIESNRAQTKLQINSLEE